jgi:hypothetical protein
MVHSNQVSFSFHLHYDTFQLHPSISCEKNYLKFSLQFPAWDMQLVGWSY